MKRRRFLQTTGLLASGAMWLPHMWPTAEMPRPHLYLTGQPVASLRSVADVGRDVQSGHAQFLWQQLLDQARADLDAPPLTPRSPWPNRPSIFQEQNNPDYYICNATGQRMLRAALIFLVTEEAAYKTLALRQLDALFDSDQWPDWIDQAHLRFGHPADLRTGMLSMDVGLTYDWLHASLTVQERQRIRDGLDRRGIQPYLQALDQDPWWTHDLNNWLTVIVGGLGIAGMALGGDHPQAQHLIDLAQPMMNRYMGIYGPDGEFNESVFYANATERPAAYHMALRYHAGGTINPMGTHPYPETCRWMMYLTFPPGRMAAFGDSHLESPPRVKFVAAAAAASRDPILQHFYLQHAGNEADPLKLLWYDPTLEPISPGDRLPLGRIFPAHGGCVVSRASWDADSSPCIVYGKAGREENHEHNDVGQLCIDGYGERLIVDLGSPSGYPADFFDEGRWKYYNASIIGHNVLMFNGREQRVPPRQRGEAVDAALMKAISGTFLDFAFNNQKGGFWKMDLTGAYEQVISVRRTVVHVLPGMVAVLDEAELPNPQTISLRWHTISPAQPDADGHFALHTPHAHLAGRILNLTNQPMALDMHRHRYAPPYHRERSGQPLEARNEPYVEATLQSDHCRFLTLFSITPKGTPTQPWATSPNGWQTETPTGPIAVHLTESHLTIGPPDQAPIWMIPRK